MLLQLQFGCPACPGSLELTLILGCGREHGQCCSLQPGALVLSLAQGIPPLDLLREPCAFAECTSLGLSILRHLSDSLVRKTNHYQRKSANRWLCNSQGCSTCSAWEAAAGSWQGVRKTGWGLSTHCGIIRATKHYMALLESLAPLDLLRYGACWPYLSSVLGSKFPIS